MRKRNYFLVGGSFLVLAFQFFTDPNGGALTTQWLASSVTPVLAVWFAYLARIALFDYLDMEELMERAKQSATGAGLTFVGVCLIMFALLGLFGNSAKAQDVANYIPYKAYATLPVVKSEMYRLWPNHPKAI